MMMQKSYTKDTLRIFWEHASRYHIKVIVLIASIIAANIAELYTPFLYKRFFDVLSQNPADAVQVLVHILVIIFSIRLVYQLMWRVYWYVYNGFYARVMSDLLNTCYTYLQYHSYSFFNNNFSGSLVRRVNRFPKAFEEISDQAILNIGQAVFRITVILGILYYRQWQLAVIVLVWALAYTSFNLWFSRYKLKYDRERAALDTKTTAHLADTVTNNINLKLFGATAREIHSFQTITDELFRVRRFSWMLGWRMETVQGLFAVCLEVGIFYAAVGFWQRGLLTVGDFVLIQAYLLQIFWVLWDVGRYIRRMYESLADAAEMTEILTTPHGVVDQEQAKDLHVVSGKLAFNAVTFRYYENKDVYKNFNLVIRPGERVALIGPSGGGKSTITKLLFRFFDIQEGSVLIDDQNIAEVTQESLRASIALVPQDPILFHRTLMENIRYARPSASDAEVLEASRLAHCHEFIEGFPEKYETYVGERGVKLSGGERQRVAIARAILKNAPILVLDEATSSLDSESEAFIQDALGNLMKGKTTIVIAHRLSTIMQMDRIIVIEHGRIVEEGKHEELIKAEQGVYQKLWEIQAGGFTA
ncbi:MAG: hypothetical protein A3C84_00275 [Candidatus Ryanbacteria bacterium RIFCSPHIGHO2_02_FULL_48_12]|nr:MAG: hypothetical protein A3C84_00275 [Candidatus Ryanbacteria bacterium RIFCSPHIGHO2_02_FULL_48_12]